MIRNPARLYEGCPPGIEAAHRLRLIDWFLLKPMGEVWDATITSAYRSTNAQATLYALDPTRAARKAKGVSQHVLGEAVDVVPEGSMTECYEWCIDHLRPFQALLEYDKGGIPECIHLSIPSSIETVVSKRLLFHGGVWTPYTGTFPVIA